jgi:hypothetical protein
MLETVTPPKNAFHRPLRFAAMAAALLSLALPLAVTAHKESESFTFGTVAGGTCRGKGTFWIATSSGTRSVWVSKYAPCIAKSASAVLSGFKRGDAVLAWGYEGSPFVATSVNYDTSPFAIPGSPRVFTGTFVSSSGGEITISLSGGDHVSFRVGRVTSYAVNGTPVTSPSYHAGDRITVTARKFTDNRLWAISVSIRK